MLTILWDNDGVLVDTEGLYFRATQEVLRTVGVPLTAEQFKEPQIEPMIDYHIDQGLLGQSLFPQRRQDLAGPHVILFDRIAILLGFLSVLVTGVVGLGKMDEEEESLVAYSPFLTKRNVILPRRASNFAASIN